MPNLLLPPYNVHRYGPEAVDCMLQDIRNDSHPFGGVTTVFGGNFRQTLPVIPHSSCPDTVAASL
jgi:hypothetical protein